MSFAQEFLRLPLEEWSRAAERASETEARRALARPSRSLREFAALLSPAAGGLLEEMAREARALTLKHFGRVMRLFAPLYVSNECVNICRYCGFSRNNPILRVTLSMEQVAAEARHLAMEGFRNVLLVAGEHPKFVSPTYLAGCVAAVRAAGIPSAHIEVAPMETADYAPIVAAGAEGLVVYQETYEHGVYATVHQAGPKKDFRARLEALERGYAAGFRRLGAGVLLGLAPWRRDAVALAAHVKYLLRTCWRAQITVSVPRLRPCAGDFAPPYKVSDRDLAQLICALRLACPKVGIVLSTRESASLRDGLARLGVTMMSAGSHTEPGGYTGAGREALHRTEKGNRMIPSEGEHATEQFEIADSRSPAAVAARLRAMGYEAVWKDWEEAIAVAP